jgi:methyl-accepting chemotaxis protein
MAEKEREEYELIPISPIRKLEKRIEELETARAALDIKEFFKQIVDIIKMNQQLINQLMASSDALRSEISKLPAKIEDLVSSLEELIGYIKTAGVEELKRVPRIEAKEGMEVLVDKLEELTETSKKMVESNKAIIELIEDLGKKLRRPPPPLPPLRRVPPKV